MKITNKYNLPEPILRAMIRDRRGYMETRGDADMTVTQLIKPPRMTALEHKHSHELEEDASDRFWALLGSAVHKILEEGGTLDTTEVRYSGNVNGWKISGKADFLGLHQRLVDYKVTSAWGILKGPKDEWEIQMNMLAHLAYMNGCEVKELEVTVIVRDWSAREAANNRDYPPRPIMVYPLNLWERGVTRTLMHARVEAHRDARINLPLCSDEDRWAKGATFAVQKSGGKRALKVLDSRGAAEEYIGQIHADIAAAGKKDAATYEIKDRPGVSKRCEQYCAAAPFCTQAQEIFEAMRVS